MTQSRNGRPSPKRGIKRKNNSRRKGLSRTHRNEIHDSLEDAIRRIESGHMTAKSARAILERIHIMRSLLGEAERELKHWLRSRKA